MANGYELTIDVDAFLDESIDTEERLGASQREGLQRLKALCEAAAG